MENKIKKMTQSIRDYSEVELDYGTLKTLKMIDDESEYIINYEDLEALITIVRLITNSPSNRPEVTLIKQLRAEAKRMKLIS